MTKKIILTLAAITLVITTLNIAVATAETDTELSTGRIVKLEGETTLYYIASDGKRYVFPNEKAYKTWFTDFDNVEIITAEELAEYTLAGNIRYRPGVLLVKIQTDPKVYAVSKGGILRWIKTERLAKKFYGENWSSLVDDIAASFFTNYTVGDNIDDEGDYDADEEVDDTDTVEGNRGLKLGHLDPALKAETKKCRAVRAVPGGQGQRATPAISARTCKLNIINEANNGEDPDETPPVISEIEVEADASTATITWTTDEEATSKVEYDDESLATSTTTETVIDSDLVTEHSLDLTGLTPNTTYYFIVQSADDNSNIATSTEDTFITAEEEEEPDETAPVISEISVEIATSTATITWETDEAASSKVEYDDESLATSTTTETIIDSGLVTEHSLDLTSLTASTTYYFIVESTDANSNTATSTEDTFTTTE